MEPSDDLCVCFHVPARKIGKFIRLNRPRFASQCSDCYGAGTGCGWCIPFIERMFEEIVSGDESVSTGMSAEEYRRRRLEYLKRLRMERLAASPREKEKLQDVFDDFEN